MKRILNFIPGILLSFIAVILAKKIAILPFAPFTISNTHPISAVLIIILLGILIGNLISLQIFKSGTNFTGNKLLQFAVILLGAKLNFAYLGTISIWHITIIILSLTFAYFITFTLAKRINHDAATLLAFGTAICGSAAIAVVGPLIKAGKNNISIAVAVVALCGSIAMLSYPYLGKLLNLTDIEFGVLAGTTVHSVPQAIGTGLIFSEAAGDKATIVKLVRILLLCPMIIIYLITQRQSSPLGSKKSIFLYFPPFVIGFLIMSILSSLSFLDNYIEIISQISSFLILSAMFAIGYQTNFKILVRDSKPATLIGLIASFALFIFTYLLLLI